MGIPYFYSWLKRKGYKGVLRRGVPKYVSSLSLDANGIIHKCAQLVYAYGEGHNPARAKLIKTADPRMLEAEFYNAVSVKLQEILTQVQPQEIFVIAIDGVAPQGKMNQQRQRRFKSALEADKGDMIFDSNAITPGTDFMIRLDNFLQRWIVSYQSTLPPKVIYSSHMVPGEGEHKVLDLMRSGEIVGNGAHVLYGMDADLIMLSMIAPLDNISLMREDIRDVIDINSFKYILSEELKLPTAINDFVVMIFTIGNDFLPHMPALETMSEAIDTLFRVYKETGKSLTTSDDDLDWTNLAIFLTNLSKEEPRLLKREAIKDVKYPSRMYKVATKRTERMGTGDVSVRLGQKIEFVTDFDYNVFRGAWYQNEMAPKGPNFNVFQKLLPGYNFGVTTNKIVNMAVEYLTGMGWVYSYYTKGVNGVNVEFVYKYHHTPLLSDLSLVLNQTGKPQGYLRDDGQIVLNPIHQLLAVLPLKSKDLLPLEVKHLMTKNSPIADLYPKEAIIEKDGKNADWQGIALIPFVNTRRIINAVNNTSKFTLERAKLYAQADTIVLKRDPAMIEINKTRRQYKRFIEEEKQKRRRGGGNRGRGRGRGGRRYQKGKDGQRGRGGPRPFQKGRGKNNRGREGQLSSPRYQTQPTRDYRGPRVTENKVAWQTRKTIL
jgi:5'-3' exoribonuclease 1